MLRKIYYKIPPSWRLLVRRLVFFPSDLFNRNSRKLAPPKGLIYTGRGDFLRQGQEWLDFFTRETALTPLSSILDIGSGIGRIALPITTFLTTGRYEGFDVIAQGVNWCTNHITTRYPNFRFRYVGLYNDLYRSDGANAAFFRFPYDDNTFDFACAISVFTHMLPEEVDNYLAESVRVLQPGGYLVATFFLIDEESHPMMKGRTFDFKYAHKGHYVMDQQVKSANVGYDRDHLFSMITKAGLRVEKEMRGYWYGLEKDSCADFQDILVLRK